ncbi:glycosyltransferase, partial [Methanothrix soehngenii]|uniref:glycosyltransferase n=1 Tax=Methanothrix soehngenii TaxID=2223 RepID=UPI002BC4C6B6|nr:glycosyltransferase [Methanothrix soehngenii]
MKILTIVPAHNEGPTLDSCINGIRNQTIETDILVVCDNCTDKTEQLAQSLEVNTLKTINNVHKKLDCTPDNGQIVKQWYLRQ